LDFVAVNCVFPARRKLVRRSESAVFLNPEPIFFNKPSPPADAPPPHFHLQSPMMQ
jgi:hypothetical protein